MINLIGKKLIHPHLNNVWTIIGVSNSYLKVKNESGALDYISFEQGLELYAEYLEKRIDELQKLRKLDEFNLNQYRAMYNSESARLRSVSDSREHYKKRSYKLDKCWNKLFTWLEDKEASSDKDDSNIYFEVTNKMTELQETLIK
ncbi:hypothetical protein RW115_01245 [Macrococcus capreoli]